MKMEERLHDRVVGQDEAVAAVSDAVRRNRAGLGDPNRPIGSSVSRADRRRQDRTVQGTRPVLFDDEAAFVRIDMSEFMEQHSVARLIGAPPGYVAMRKWPADGGGSPPPYCVILLDEIEKAHRDVFNVLLQVLDDGRLTDGHGRTVDFRNTIVVMTSNIGGDRIQAMSESGADELESRPGPRPVEAPVPPRVSSTGSTR